jgi:CRISPR-associated protein Cmr6
MASQKKSMSLGELVGVKMPPQVLTDEQKKQIILQAIAAQNEANAGCPNIGWLFHKRYYKGCEKDLVAQVNRDENEIVEVKKEREAKLLKHFRSKNEGIFLQSSTYEYWDTLGAHSFTLKTTYPGLVLGTGYSHETGTEGEFKIGFYFDWTTGLPIIPGSSVKGVLRSAFMQEGFVAELLRDKGISLTDAQIAQLETEIFGNRNGGDDFSKGRDIFHDAVITSAPTPFLGDDYITPHINRDKPEMTPFSNPTPLLFLKVLPSVAFEFRFGFVKSEFLDEKQKGDLFKSILQIIGIGAKTNVGYGQLC